MSRSEAITRARRRRVRDVIKVGSVVVLSVGVLAVMLYAVGFVIDLAMTLDHVSVALPADHVVTG